VHSHPGVDTEHSEYDDEMMPSRKALSVVVPCHGRWPIEAWPRDIGIHEFVDNYWHLLTPRQANERVLLSRSETVEVRDLR
jgi:proteasome lid subunit RPN8/RPN11